MKIMEAGKLKHRIEVWGREEYQNDFLETDYRNKKIMTIWSEIIPQTGNMQRAQAETILTKCTHKVKVRYRSGKNITPDMWLIFRGKRFDIRYILNPYFSNESLEIFVEEVTV